MHSEPKRIDVHQHVVPPFWAEALADHGGDPSGWHSPDWSPDAALRFMDAHSIATGILSLTAPSVTGWEGTARVEMSQRVNDYSASLVMRDASRFGNFATLPLPDVDAAIVEATRAFDDLGADGIVVLSNYGGRYLGDALFDPLWAELNQRAAVVFIHPGKPAIPMLEGLPGPIVDYPFDTTRTAVHMVLRKVLERYPAIRFILSHAGGFLPFASHRFAELSAAVIPGAPSVEKILESFRRFHFDTALSAGEAALPSLMAFADENRVLFGSDFPYAPASVGGSFAHKLDAWEGFHEGQSEKLNRMNGQTLFPRLRDE